jgi:D-glycero-D-manno-heptose 1,7-bisphosphate phosphatase
MALRQNAAVFLDKDGTLVKDIPYNADPQKIILEAGVAKGLRRLSEAGLPLIVVTNQSGIARGYFQEEQMEGIIAKLGEILYAEAGAALSGFYYCPHHPEGSVEKYALDCPCRKPRPGLLLAAAQDQGLSLEESWMVGDILDDMEAGKRAGCQTILVSNGNETEWQCGPLREPDYVATDFEEAAEVILHKSSQCRSFGSGNHIRAHKREIK